MSQHAAWNKEYVNPKLLSLDNEPQKDVKRFLKWLKKEHKCRLDDMRVLDLGSGTGRNANYCADHGAKVVGIEIAQSAIVLAQKRAKEMKVSVEYLHQSMGEKYPFDDGSFDLVIDVTSSNSLSEAERDVYLKEVSRVLKSAGSFYVRALCKDGDKNAQRLIKEHPGKEKDTYIMPDLKLTERAFSKEDFIDLYSKNFGILILEKKTSYQKVDGRIYKRNYWNAYLRKV